MPTLSEQMELPPKRCITREEYQQIGRLGLFEGERLELIEGEIVEMSPISIRHNLCVSLAQRITGRVFRRGHHVRVQSTFLLANQTEIQPDIAVLVGKERDYAARHPDHAALIIEVAETSQVYDLGAKMQLYAWSGIEDYWVVDTSRLCLYVHRHPVADSAAQYGFRYDSIVELGWADTIAPIARPNSVISVADLLP